MLILEILGIPIPFHKPHLRVEFDLRLLETDGVDRSQRNTVDGIFQHHFLGHPLLILDGVHTNFGLTHLDYFIIEETVEISVITIDIERFLRIYEANG